MEIAIALILGIIAICGAANVYHQRKVNRMMREVGQMSGRVTINGVTIDETKFPRFAAQLRKLEAKK